MQASFKPLVPRLSFQRLVLEILQNLSDIPLRMQTETVEALREAAEMYIVELFEDAFACAVHTRRVTLMLKDIRLVQVIRGPNDPGMV